MRYKIKFKSNLEKEFDSLCGEDLRGADLIGANLKDADMKDAITGKEE